MKNSFKDSIKQSVFNSFSSAWPLCQHICNRKTRNYVYTYMNPVGFVGSDMTGPLRRSVIHSHVTKLI